MNDDKVPRERLLELEAMRLDPTQFVIPKRAANAVDFLALRRQAREAGLANDSIEANERHAGPSNTRITCRPAMALLLIEALRVVATQAESKHDGDLLIASAVGVKAAFNALDRVTPRKIWTEPELR